MSRKPPQPLYSEDDVLNIQRRPVLGESSSLEAKILAAVSTLKQDANPIVETLITEPHGLDLSDKQAASNAPIRPVARFWKSLASVGIAASIVAATYTLLPLSTSEIFDDEQHIEQVVLSPNESASDLSLAIEELEFQEAFLFADEQMFAQR